MAYDEQLRTDAEMARAHEVVGEGPLLWGVFDHGGFVSYRDLGGAAPPTADVAVADRQQWSGETSPHWTSGFGC